jgi:hypothetical protein
MSMSAYGKHKTQSISITRWEEILRDLAYNFRIKYGASEMESYSFKEWMNLFLSEIK